MSVCGGCRLVVSGGPPLVLTIEYVGAAEVAVETLEFHREDCLRAWIHERQACPPDLSGKVAELEGELAEAPIAVPCPLGHAHCSLAQDVA